MGAVVNLRPDLFHTVVAHVPFVDVINTMLDDTLPLTIAEYEEWGNPNDRAFYDYMRTYSPYDNVQSHRVPGHSGHRRPERPASFLLGTGEVGGEAARLVNGREHIRARKPDYGSRPRGPLRGRYARLKEKAFEYAFVLTR